MTRGKAMCNEVANQRFLKVSLLNRWLSMSVGRKLDFSNTLHFSRSPSRFSSFEIWISHDHAHEYIKRWCVITRGHVSKWRFFVYTWYMCTLSICMSNLLVNVLVCHAQNLSQGLHQLICMDTDTSYGCSEVQLRAYLSTQQHWESPDTHLNRI